MPYQFVTEKQDYTHFASGRVFYNLPGQPVFPVRLASEIFQRGMTFRRANGLIGPVVLYDPCCGSAYHLAGLAYLHWQDIAIVMGSDIDGDVLETARRNLSLLTESGLRQRMIAIEEMFTRFGKESHAGALESAHMFASKLQGRLQNHALSTYLFQANALAENELGDKIPQKPVDLVIADIPYGQHSTWIIPETRSSLPKSPVWHMLQALRACVAEHSVVAIAADKSQKISHEAYQRLGTFQVGKRRVVFLQPIPHPMI